MFEISPILYFLAIFVEHRVGLLERRPALDRVGQEARARGLERPAELLGDLHRGAPQHLGVELVGAGLDLLLDLVEERDQLVALDREAVALGLGAERVVDAGLPVDQGAVDVEGDERDLLRNRHRAVMMPRRSSRTASGAASAPESIECQRPWICSNIRASSCSPGTACRSRRASRRAPSRRRWPPPTRSATRAWSRPRSRSAAAASSAGSSSPAIAPRPRQHAEAILGMDIRGLTVHEVWIEGGLGDRLGVLRLGRLRPLGQGAAGDALDQGRHGHRGRSPTRTPTRSRTCTSTRCSAFRTSTAAGSRSRPASTPTWCGRSARCWPSSTRCSSPRRRRWSRSTR